MATTQISGTIRHITPPELVGQNQTPKRTAVVDVAGERWSESYQVEIFGQDKVEMMNGVQPGTPAVIDCFVNGREYTKSDGTKGYFTSLRLARISVQQPAAPAQFSPQQVPQQVPQQHYQPAPQQAQPGVF